MQFVNVLDFVIVMPLGPDFASALGIASARLPLVGTAYTAAAAVSGLVGSFVLDRFDRRRALGVAMTGLAFGTLACALAPSFALLLVARVVAGAFGGPATSLSYSIVADLVPPERRGKAMGAVMGAFSLAAVLGVPAGLQLALWGGWQLPFLIVALLGFLVTAGAFALLPPLREHLTAGAAGAPKYRDLLTRPVVLTSYTLTAVLMMGSFILFPSIPAYVLDNLHYPRERLGLLYLVGGCVSFITMRYAGKLVDRYGSFATGAIGSLLFIVVLYFAYYDHAAWFVPPAMFAAMMFSLGFRNVAGNTLTSKVPLSRERARFMSLQSSVQHMASAAGAYASTSLLTVDPSGALVGIPRIAVVAMAMTALVPLLMKRVEDAVRYRDAMPTPPAATESVTTGTLPHQK